MDPVTEGAAAQVTDTGVADTNGPADPNIHVDRLTPAEERRVEAALALGAAQQTPAAEAILDMSAPPRPSPQVQNLPIPTPGRIVLYRLTYKQADAINLRRARKLINHVRGDNGNGAILNVGNNAYEGDELPMMIVKVWGDTPTSSVNGQVALDGNDTLWVTSVSVGTGPGSFSWPQRG